MLALAAWTLGRVRNPEKAHLDDEARKEAPGRFVTLSQGVTHYELAGPDSGRTVVLASGYSMPYYVWDQTTDALTAAGYRVLRFDYYGRGYSDRLDARYDRALYDTQLGELLDSLGIQGPVDLMGLSFGGFVTAHFVAAHPERVRSLTLVDPQTEPTPLSATLRLPWIGPWIWQVRDVPGMDEGQLADFFRPEAAPPDWVERYRTQMRFRGFGRALLRTDVTTSDADFPALYAEVGRTGIPVLLVWGRQDTVVPIEYAHKVTDGIPGIRFEPIDSAGHIPSIEQAQRVNAVMLDFLDSHTNG